jgi:ApaG protein
MGPKYNIKVDAQSFYIEAQSIPNRNRYVFAYTITIHNMGDIPAKLLTRHWVITDSNGKVEEVAARESSASIPTFGPGKIFSTPVALLSRRR